MTGNRASRMLPTSNHNINRSTVSRLLVNAFDSRGWGAPRSSRRPPGSRWAPCKPPPQWPVCRMHGRRGGGWGEVNTQRVNWSAFMIPFFQSIKFWPSFCAPPVSAGIILFWWSLTRYTSSFFQLGVMHLTIKPDFKYKSFHPQKKLLIGFLKKYVWEMGKVKIFSAMEHSI